MRHRKAAAAIVAGEPTVLPRRRGERLRTRRRRAASGAVPARPRHPAGRPGCRALDRKPARCSARSTGRPPQRTPARPRRGPRPEKPRRPSWSVLRRWSVSPPGSRRSTCGRARWQTRFRLWCWCIGSLGVGLGLTLWLSTDAAERSYQLSNARERTRMLQQHKEALERDVREAASAPALAEAARRQGMIPTRDTAHLVQDPDGNWVVVGTPKPADGVPPPPLNTKLPEDPPPPPKPAAVPLEVPVRVTPGPDDPAPPARSGPEVLVRTPDGTATLGGATHLPTQAGPQLPGPVPIPGAPGPMPAPPLGAVPSPAPAENPVPLQVGAAPPAGLPGPAPVAATPGLSGGSQPMVAPPAPVPANGEQFGPVTAPVPTAPGAPR